MPSSATRSSSESLSAVLGERFLVGKILLWTVYLTGNLRSLHFNKRWRKLFKRRVMSTYIASCGT
ncbi:hypothetical protein SAMN05216332_11615 [Nitrosospira briensis]|nr:hypothetical protein SAMN05216332_11615 [Nitrosospira briensis]